jgi:hypothetical protein
MSKLNAENTRNRLRLTTSSLVLLASLAMAGGANAQTVLSLANSPYNAGSPPGGDTYVVVPTGLTAYMEQWADGTFAGLPTISFSNNQPIVGNPASCLWGGCTRGAAEIRVQQGATLIMAGAETGAALGNSSYWPWWGIESLFNVQGDVIVGEGGWNIMGTNTFAGDIHLLHNAQFILGQSWHNANITFGPNAHIEMESGAQFYLNEAGTAVIGGALSGVSGSSFELAGGTLVVNGQNTTTSPFLGTFTLDAGSVLQVGDATHATAIFGDPNHTDGSSYTLNVHGTISGSARLQGYGKIYGTVTNTGGIVQPGGTAGTMGTLTVSRYTQDATGMLQVEVTPTAASQLHVLGNATLNGSLRVTIDPGVYGTNVYNIVTVDGTMTGQFSSITTSSGASGAIAAVTQNAHGYQVVTEVVSGANATAPVVNGHLVSANRLNTEQFVASLYDVIAANAPNHGAVQQAELAHNVYAWLSPFGRMSSISRDHVGYHTNAEGVTGGIELRTADNTTLGIAASYAHENLKAKGASNAHSNTIDLAVYGGINLQYVRVDGVAFYNTYDAAMARNFGSNGVARSAPSGYAYGGSLQVSKSLFHGLVTPYMRGMYSRQHLASAIETGATVLDLKFNAINANTFVGDVGFRIDPLYRKPECKTKLDITVAIEHDFSKLGETVTGEFPIGSGQAWNTFWKGNSENTLVGTLNVVHPVTDNIELFGRVDGRVSLFQTASEISVGGRYRF